MNPHVPNTSVGTTVKTQPTLTTTTPSLPLHCSSQNYQSLTGSEHRTMDLCMPGLPLKKFLLFCLNLSGMHFRSIIQCLNFVVTIAEPTTQILTYIFEKPRAGSNLSLVFITLDPRRMYSRFPRWLPLVQWTFLKPSVEGVGKLCNNSFTLENSELTVSPISKIGKSHIMKVRHTHIRGIWKFITVFSPSKLMISASPSCLCIRPKERHWLLWQP